jgi:hypothetical protein
MSYFDVLGELSCFWKTESGIQTASSRAEMRPIMSFDMGITLSSGHEAFVERSAVYPGALV